MSVFDQPIVQAIWDEKYRLKRPDGSSDEDTIEDSMVRVVEGVYTKDPDQTAAKDALGCMLDRSWCPAGRIHAGAGTNKRVSLINCFVSPIIEDSMLTEIGGDCAGIMDALRTAAVTQQMGGGIGMNFSTLRPKGGTVKRAGSISSGPLYFMDMWDAMCITIRSAGNRRGAMMATLDDDHPDLPAFIDAKHEAGRLTNFNMSILISDSFMIAVEEDAEWCLGFGVPRADNNHVGVQYRDGKEWYVYQRVPARYLWNKIIESTYKYAEPGVIFIDRVNKMNNLYYCEDIRCTNPCGEQPLPPHGDCNLGHVNLAVLVDAPFTAQARVDYERLKRVVTVGVRFLDNVLDVSQFPVEEQAKEAIAKRRVGLGVTGLGNLLQQMRMPYGSPSSKAVTSQIMRQVRDAAYRESVNLAEQRGSFPLFDRDKYLEGEFVKTLPEDIRQEIYAKGIRNGLLLSVAPVGTASVYYCNVSSGIEPTFAWEYYRKVRMADGELKEFGQVKDYGYLKYCEFIGTSEPVGGIEDLPDYMVTALELSVEAHLSMQSVVQKYVDASISKTINCPVDMPFDEFKGVYSKAYEIGLKGCTTYRPSDVRGSVLSVESSEPLANSAVVATPVSDVVPLARPLELSGTTYKLKWPTLNYAFYLTVNDVTDDDGRRVPFEIFINSKSMEHQEWITALTRMVSAIFRRGGDITFLVEELEQVFSASGGTWVDGKYVPSLVARIGGVLKEHFRRLGLLAPEEPDETKSESPSDVDAASAHNIRLLRGGDTPGLMRGELCPMCQQPTLYRQEGCKRCSSCSYSSCE